MVLVKLHNHKMYAGKQKVAQMKEETECLRLQIGRRGVQLEVNFQKAIKD